MLIKWIDGLVNTCNLMLIEKTSRFLDDQKSSANSIFTSHVLSNAALEFLRPALTTPTVLI